MDLDLDREWQAKDTTEPYTFTVDTTKVSERTHSLKAVAIDKWDNSASSQIIVFYCPQQSSLSQPRLPRHTNRFSQRSQLL
jgi:hypothetical protein